ncbi:hypothetical protein ACFL3L_02560, partial [Candidatus Neomarinimicrobiota bacterium]
MYKIFGIITGLFALSLFMTIHLYFQPNKSVNKNTIALKGLTDSVLVISDMHGVTSIKASS